MGLPFCLPFAFLPALQPRPRRQRLPLPLRMRLPRRWPIISPLPFPRPNRPRHPAWREITGLLVVYEKSGNLWAWTGSGISQITSGGPDSRPRLSADGKLVAFQRGAELWAVEISGQNPRKLYGEAGALPLQFEFAPSSHKVYFTSAASDGTPRFDLNLADVDANTAKSLLPAGQGGEFTFLPDGSQLALVQPDKIIVARAGWNQARRWFINFRQ